VAGKRATLATLMKRQLVAIDGTRSVREAVATMVREETGSVFVTAEERVVGILTERDVLRAALAEREVFDNPVHAIMSSPLFTLASNASPFEALEFMAKKGIRRVPVTVRGQVRGLLTQRDLVNWLVSHPEEIPHLVSGKTLI